MDKLFEFDCLSFKCNQLDATNADKKKLTDFVRGNPEIIESADKELLIATVNALSKDFKAGRRKDQKNEMLDLLDALCANLFTDLTKLSFSNNLAEMKSGKKILKPDRQICDQVITLVSLITSRGLWANFETNLNCLKINPLDAKEQLTKLCPKWEMHIEHAFPLLTP